MTTPTHPNHVTDRQGFPCTLLWNLLPVSLLHLLPPRGHCYTSDLFQEPSTPLPFSTSCLPEVIAILQTCSKEPSTPLPFSTSCLPEVIAILQTCSKEPSTPSLPFSLPTRDQSPGPRSNSRKDVSMAILFWVTFQNLSQGTDSHKAKQCPSKMN